MQASAKDEKWRRKIGGSAKRTMSDYFSVERFREAISKSQVLCERTDGSSQTGLFAAQHESNLT